MKNYKQFYLDQINSLWLPTLKAYKAKMDRDLQKVLIDIQRYIKIMPKSIKKRETIAEYLIEQIKEEFTIPRRMGDKNQVALDANMESLLPKLKKAIETFHQNLENFMESNDESGLRTNFREGLSYCMGVSKLYLNSTLKI